MAVSKPPSFVSTGLPSLRRGLGADKPNTSPQEKPSTQRQPPAAGSFLGGLASRVRSQGMNTTLRVGASVLPGAKAIQTISTVPARNFNDISDEEMESCADEGLALLTMLKAQPAEIRSHHIS
jgi:hypothetical protein